MDSTNKEAMAVEIIEKLDEIARDVCSYDYGLPTYGEHLEKLVTAVVEILNEEEVNK